MLSSRSPLLATALLSSLGIVTGCGGGGDGGGSDAASLTLTLTDAASDEIAAFTVGIESIRLISRAAGTVGVLKAPTTVDFVTLADLSQLLNVLDVAPGIYDAAEITFDFTGASCVLVDQTTPALLLDSKGQPLSGLVTLPLTLDGSPIIAARGRRRLLELDFDLDQSMTVDSAANVVTLAPSVVVRVDRANPKELLVFGTLESVDTAAGTAVIDLETLERVLVRSVNLRFKSTTIYQVDGVPYVGTAGLAALAAKPATTWVQGYGALDATATNTFVMPYVEAGVGTYNGGSDILEGHVLDRAGGTASDATLTVVGNGQDASHGIHSYNTVYTVDVHFADTKVLRRGFAETYDSDALNVGQRVRIFGTFAGTVMDATSAMSVVRVQPSRASGYALGAPNGGLLEIDVRLVDEHDVSEFVFANGGATPPDPLHLLADVGSLGSGLDVVAGTPIETRGFFTAVGDSGADVSAIALTNRELVPLMIHLLDIAGTGLEVTPTVTSSRIELALSGIAAPEEAADIDQGFVGITPLPFTPTATILPPAEGSSIYTLSDTVSGSFAIYSEFADFSDALAGSLAAGRRLSEVRVSGSYDDLANSIATLFASATVE